MDHARNRDHVLANSKRAPDGCHESNVGHRLDAMVETIWQAKGSDLLPLVHNYRLADSPQASSPEAAVREGIRRFLHFVARTDPSLGSWKQRENSRRLHEEVKALVKHTPHYNAIFTQIWSRHGERLENILSAKLRGSALQAKADPHEEVRRGISHFLSKQIKSRGEIESWETDTRLLFAIVVAQQKDRWDYWTAQLRDFRRDQSLDQVLDAPGHRASSVIREDVSQQMASLVTECLQHATDPKHKEAICSRLTGCSFEEVARKLELPLEKVEDLFDEFRSRLWDQVTPELELSLEYL